MPQTSRRRPCLYALALGAAVGSLPVTRTLAQPSEFIWTGLGADTLWSNPQNWDQIDSGLAPSGNIGGFGEDMSFPDLLGVGNAVSTVDSTFTIVGPSAVDPTDDFADLDFPGNVTSYSLNGAPGASITFEHRFGSPGEVRFEGASLTQHFLNVDLFFRGVHGLNNEGDWVTLQSVALQEDNTPFNPAIPGEFTIDNDGIVVFAGVISGQGNAQMTTAATSTGMVVLGNIFADPTAQGDNTFGDGVDGSVTPQGNDTDFTVGVLHNGGQLVIAKNGAVGNERLVLQGGTLASATAVPTVDQFEIAQDVNSEAAGADIRLEPISTQLTNATPVAIQDIPLLISGGINVGDTSQEIFVGQSADGADLELIFQGNLQNIIPGSDPTDRDAAVVLTKTGEGRLTIANTQFGGNDRTNNVANPTPDTEAYTGSFILKEGTLRISVGEDPFGFTGDFTVGDAADPTDQVAIEAVTGPDNDDLISITNAQFIVAGDFKFQGQPGDNDLNLLDIFAGTIDFQNRRHTIEVDPGMNLYFDFGAFAPPDLINATDGFIKTGGGIFAMNSTSATFAGDVRVEDGLLLIGFDNTLGDPGALTAADSITLTTGGGIGSSLSTLTTITRNFIFEGNFRVGGFQDITLIQSPGFGSIPGVLDLDGNRVQAGDLVIAIDEFRTATFGSPISSNIGFTKTRRGTLQLTNENPLLAGNIVVQQGTLRVNVPAPGGNGALPDDAVITVNLNPADNQTTQRSTLRFSSDETIGQVNGTGDLIIDAGATLTTAGMTAGTLSGRVSGGGDWVLNNGGGITLSGNNAGFTGDLTLSNGTLTVANANALGTGGNLIINGGALRATSPLTSGKGLTFNNNLSINAGSDVTFNGNSTINDNADAGYAINVADGVVFTMAGNLTAVDANEPLTKTGAGTWAFSGNGNLQMAPVTINAGTFDFAGSLGGNLVVNSTLRNAGTVGGTLTVNNNAAIDPGLGTVTVNGGGNAFTLGSGATYTVDVQKTGDTIQNSRVRVTAGNATLNAGASIVLNPLTNSGSLRQGDQFVIVQVDGNGTLTNGLNNSNLQGDSSFLLNFTLDEVGNDLVITTQVEQGALGGQAPGGTTGGASLVEELLASGDTPDDATEFFDAVTQLRSDQVAGFERATEPRAVNEATQTVLNLPSVFTGNLANYLANKRAGIPTLATINQRVSSDAAGGVQLASLAPTPELLQAALTSQRELRDMRRVIGPEDPYTPWSAFARGFLTFDEADGNDDRTGSESTSIGGQVGMDYTFEDIDVTVGGFLGYAYTDTDFEDSFGSSEADSFRFGGYAMWYSGQWWVDGSLSFGYHQIDSSRNITFNAGAGVFSNTVDSDTSAFDLTGSVNAGYDFIIRDIPGLILTPRGGVVYTFYSQDELAEQGGNGAMTIESFEESYLDVIGAFNASYVYTNQVNQQTYITELGAGLKYQALGDETDYTYRLAGTTPTRSLTVDNGEEFRPFVEAGVSWLWNKRNALYVRYSGEFPSDGMTHTAQLGYVVKF